MAPKIPQSNSTQFSKPHKLVNSLRGGGGGGCMTLPLVGGQCVGAGISLASQ
jgi:hypothetical protein